MTVATLQRALIIALTLYALIQLAGSANGQTYRAPWPWIAIADCETGGDSTPGRAPYRANWHLDSTFDGGLQFHPTTWRNASSYPDVRRIARRYTYAWQAPAWVQVAVARSWLRRTSWKQWPVCSRKAGVA